MCAMEARVACITASLASLNERAGTKHYRSNLLCTRTSDSIGCTRQAKGGTRCTFAIDTERTEQIRVIKRTVN